MNNYFRITGYWKQEDLGFILDSNGMFEKLWEFSKYLMERGFRVIAVDREQYFVEGTLEKVKEQSPKLMIRAIGKDEPKTFPNTPYEDKEGVMVQLGDAIYLSNVE